MASDPFAGLDPERNPVVVRDYKGRTQTDAAVLFSQEAPLLAARGYRPVSQSWADGRPGVGRVLMLGMAANSMRPDGTLTVTYQFQGLADATKVCPRCAETIKAAAAVCRYCGYEYQGQAPQPVVADPPTAPAWTPTHRVPDDGLRARTAPDPSLVPVLTLSAGLELVVAERAGDWARVVAKNGWTGWVDGRRLVTTA